jgi:hypothetical protein
MDRFRIPKRLGKRCVRNIVGTTRAWQSTRRFPAVQVSFIKLWLDVTVHVVNNAVNICAHRVGLASQGHVHVGV